MLARGHSNARTFLIMGQLGTCKKFWFIFVDQCPLPSTLQWPGLSTILCSMIYDSGEIWGLKSELPLPVFDTSCCNILVIFQTFFGHNDDWIKDKLLFNWVFKPSITRGTWQSTIHENYWYQEKVFSRTAPFIHYDPIPMPSHVIFVSTQVFWVLYSFQVQSKSQFMIWSFVHLPASDCFWFASNSYCLCLDASFLCLSYLACASFFLFLAFIFTLAHFLYF